MSLLAEMEQLCQFLDEIHRNYFASTDPPKIYLDPKVHRQLQNELNSHLNYKSTDGMNRPGLIIMHEVYIYANIQHQPTDPRVPSKSFR